MSEDVLTVKKDRVMAAMEKCPQAKEILLLLFEGQIEKKPKSIRLDRLIMSPVKDNKVYLDYMEPDSTRIWPLLEFHSSGRIIKCVGIGTGLKKDLGFYTNNNGELIIQ